MCRCREGRHEILIFTNSAGHKVQRPFQEALPTFHDWCSSCRMSENHKCRGEENKAFTLDPNYLKRGPLLCEFHLESDTWLHVTGQPEVIWQSYKVILTSMPCDSDLCVVFLSPLLRK